MRPLSEDGEMIASLQEVMLPTKAGLQAFEVLTVRPQKEHWLLTLAGVADRAQGEAYKGKGVYVPDEWLLPLAEDEFFIHDLLGASCWNQQGERLGEIVDYFENGPQVVFQVQGEGKKEFLFPATKSILLEVDCANKRVVIEPPEGLLELND